MKCKICKEEKEPEEVYRQGRMCKVCAKILKNKRKENGKRKLDWRETCQWHRWSHDRCGMPATHRDPYGGIWRACEAHRLNGDVPYNRTSPFNKADYY